MIARILATAITEAHIARRNRWVLIAVALVDHGCFADLTFGLSGAFGGAAHVIRRRRGRG